MLADAIEASLPPREDRDPGGRLFADTGSDALRTSIAKACRALAIPLWSPHDLRHRRISLLHSQGRSWAEVGAFVGQRKLSITADTYTHVLVDGREVDYGALLALSAWTVRIVRHGEAPGAALGGAESPVAGALKPGGPNSTPVAMRKPLETNGSGVRNGVTNEHLVLGRCWVCRFAGPCNPFGLPNKTL